MSLIALELTKTCHTHVHGTIKVAINTGNPYNLLQLNVRYIHKEQHSPFEMQETVKVHMSLTTPLYYPGHEYYYIHNDKNNIIRSTYYIQPSSKCFDACTLRTRTQTCTQAGIVCMSRLCFFHTPCLYIWLQTIVAIIYRVGIYLNI